jgi:hypothetical protein
MKDFGKGTLAKLATALVPAGTVLAAPDCCHGARPMASKGAQDTLFSSLVATYAAFSKRPRGTKHTTVPSQLLSNH